MGTATLPAPPQSIIEKKMKEIIALGNYEAVYLFTHEGLPLAEVIADDQMDPDRLAEMSLLFHDVRKLGATLKGIDKLQEVVIRGANLRRIVFRFFPAFNHDVVLVAVIPPRKSYRKVTNELQKRILSIPF